ncbi:hypothetical protein MYSE111917_10190 [Mycobacterium senriense]|uniref:Uncharacterized protein n=1 Tax=Mycobacterium senriense TaxID=2775496 RepID=A0ABN6IGQ1_9MYCO|nr:hypothetical protein [Mycobacterium senriense]BCZ22984.1 hypothetical protein MTY59_28390 [Mycobacterium senriense]
MAEKTEKAVSVKVQAPFRVVHEGNAFTHGDTLTVPESIGAEWERSRWIERVTGKS